MVLLADILVSQIQIRLFGDLYAGMAQYLTKGVNIHPGSAKNTMVNSLLVAMEINSMLSSEFSKTPSILNGRSRALITKFKQELF